jgi:hypothetical protein
LINLDGRGSYEIENIPAQAPFPAATGQYADYFKEMD